MSNELWWYVARSCGLVGYALLAAGVLWGLAVSGRFRNRAVTPAWVLDLHRHLGGLSVIFVALHVAGLLCDKYVHFGPAAIFVPLASTWRPGAVAWGVAAMYLLIAVEATSLARRMLPRRIWRATHLLSFPLFVLSTVHLLLSGTDAAKRPVQVAVAVLCVVVAVGTWARIRTERRRNAIRLIRTTTTTPQVSPAGHEVMSPRTNPADRFGSPGNDRVVDRPEPGPAQLTAIPG